MMFKKHNVLQVRRGRRGERGGFYINRTLKLHCPFFFLKQDFVRSEIP